jgi:GT2 family glycosyltransferase
MTENPDAPRPIDIVIPFYRNVGLVSSLFSSLATVKDELKALDCTVVTVNDSPDDAELKPRLLEATGQLSPEVSCEIIENERNLGFVRSVNKALERAVSRGRDVVLLNSDVLVYPGALTEVRRVAYCDPMIGFVSPRSNNATICTLPHLDEFKKLRPDECYAVFQQLSPHLPDYHLVPTVVGFCLFIRLEILKEFGLFDESYGMGYNEENDLIMRANRCGFRAALANHAFVYHMGERSFSASAFPKQAQEDKNAALLHQRFPEYPVQVGRYFDSPHFKAERLLSALIPDADGRVDLLFDFSSVGPYHNGTFEVAKDLLSRAAEKWVEFFNLHVMASDEAIRFHKLDRLDRVFFVPTDTSRTFAVAFRFSQPFEYEQVLRMGRVGLLNVYGMLDPIAVDCLYLNQPDLEAMWEAVFQHADGVLYISDFVGEQFRRRFRLRPGLPELVTYLSLDFRDYAPPHTPSGGSYILVIGNAFAHKRVSPTVDALSQAFPRQKIVAIGLQEDGRRNVMGYTSGSLTEGQMDSLLRGARLVVLPSLYEGFGIPLVRSLAYHKPVLARSIPVTRAIRERIHAEDNLILFSTIEELTEVLKRGFPVWREIGSLGDPEGGWDTITDRIGEFLRRLLESFSFSEVLVPRLTHLRLLESLRSVSAANRALPGGSAEAPEQAVHEYGARLTEALRRVEELRLIAKDRATQLEQVHKSMSWRITAPMRAVAGLLLRRVGRE